MRNSTINTTSEFTRGRVRALGYKDGKSHDLAGRADAADGSWQEVSCVRHSLLLLFLFLSARVFDQLLVFICRPQEVFSEQVVVVRHGERELSVHYIIMLTHLISYRSPKRDRGVRQYVVKLR